MKILPCFNFSTGNMVFSRSMPYGQPLTGQSPTGIQVFIHKTLLIVDQINQNLLYFQFLLLSHNQHISVDWLLDFFWEVSKFLLENLKKWSGDTWLVHLEIDFTKEKCPELRRNFISRLNSEESSPWQTLSLDSLLLHTANHFTEADTFICFSGYLLQHKPYNLLLIQREWIETSSVIIYKESIKSFFKTASALFT
jgi:hypothetical protein